ncbi:PD-(D/E)XK nuclease-like domain-containing protein, partial [Yersinia pestis]
TDDVHDFGKSVEKYGYHVQAAFYSLIMSKVFGIEADFAFCVVGKSLECGRYPVSLGLLEDADFDEGMLQVRETITQL